MRAILATVLAALFAADVAAQDPKPVGGTPPPVKQVTEKPATEKPATGKPATGKSTTGTPEAGTPAAGASKDGTPKAGEGAKPADPKPGDAKSTDRKNAETTEVDLPTDQPLPQSGDPADLQAMRSAQAMVAAERRLRSRIKAGQIKDIDQLLSFEELTSWPYEDALKGMPKAVKELDGKQVVMIGFMLPIDEVEDIKEFLLVQSLWACCYGQPPDINGIVRVVMKGDRRCDYQFDPILVKGTFKVEATLEDGYCIDIFQLHATEVSLLK